MYMTILIPASSCLRNKTRKSGIRCGRR